MDLERLRENEALFRVIVDNMLDAVLILDWDGTILFNNSAAARLVEVPSPGEAIGWNAAQFIHPDWLLAVASDLERVKAGDTGFFSEYKLVTMKGEEKWVEGLGTKTLLDGRELNLVILREITGKKRMEEELRRAYGEMEERVWERETKYRTFLNTLRDMVFITDRHGRLTYVNQMFESILGRPLATFHGRPFSDMVAPEHRTAVIDRYRQGMSGDVVPVYEVDFLGADGRKIPVELNVSTLCDAAGTSIGRIGIARDISGRRQAETLYRTLANTSRAGVYIVQKGRFRFINTNAAKYAGYSADEMIGMKSVGILHPEDREQSIKNTRKMLSGETTVPYEFRIITKDGRIRWIMETVTPIVYQGKQAVLGNSMDTTEQREARLKLEESERQLAEIIAGTSVPTFVIDRRHRVTHWNGACEVLTGILSRDIIGTQRQWTAFYAKERMTLADLIVNQAPEDLLAVHYEGRQRRSSLISGAYEVETFFPDLSPQGRWLFITASPLKDMQGQVTGAIETLQDVTERKHMEEEVRLLVVTDQLTGLYNRRGFIALAEQQLKVSVRSRRPLLLCFADLDGMKRINDTWGHDEGDRALCAAAVVMKDAFRTSDIVARIGGDEFAILSIDATDTSPASLIRRLEERLEQFNERNEKPYRLAMSIGAVACDPEETGTLDEYMRRADAEMYRHKQGK